MPFIGRVDALWIGPRKMRLHEAFTFVDAASRVWVAPAGTIVDGASIPRAFWRAFGPPFVGLYRYASVVHDYYCVSQTRTWQDTHKMFHEACIAGGVGRRKARMMYWSVRNFGPRWPAPTP